MNNQAALLPFHAINEFMRPDFRLSVIRDVISNLETLPSHNLREINSLIKHHVKIPGFRNSEKAPALLKVMPTAKVFEKNPAMVGSIISAWASLHKELMDQVYAMLISRHWDHIDELQDITFDSLSQDFLNKWPILPPNIDRTKIPGFIPRWPKGENFEELYQTYTEQFPNENNSIDQVSLMAVWITLRLPYTIEENDSEPISNNV